jgi:hypothetical protein
VATASLCGPAAAKSVHHSGDRATQSSSSTVDLPVSQIESIVKIRGSIINGDLSLGVERTDIGTVSLHGVPIKPSFEVNGEFDFQPLGHGQALMNGDLPVKDTEINPVIDAILSHGLSFQAEHQHFYDFQPMVWFIHLREKGSALAIARALSKVLAATSTPLPQAPPSHPTTPLNVHRLKTILHGYDAEVGSDGVVTVYVARRNPITLDGVRANPATNIATNVGFEPLNASGTQTAVVPDFGMQSGEVNRVIATMRSMSWDIGCLYNQETAEHPQLYFSHDFKTGDPYTLAQEVRDGLNHMNSQ